MLIRTLVSLSLKILLASVSSSHVVLTFTYNINLKKDPISSLPLASLA